MFAENIKTLTNSGCTRECHLIPILCWFAIFKTYSHVWNDFAGDDRSCTGSLIVGFTVLHFSSLLFPPLISLRVTLYTSVEMKTRHPQRRPSTWRRFLQVRVVLSAHSVTFTLISDCSLASAWCLWQCVAIVCRLHVNIYWQATPCCTPQSQFVPHPPRGLDNADRKMVCGDAKPARHLKWLFCCWSKKQNKKKTQLQHCIVLWQQPLKASGPSHQPRIGHRLCGQSERIPCYGLALTFSRDNRKANNTCCLAQVASYSQL